MTPFGSGQQQQQQQGGTGEDVERWEIRTLTIVDGDEKQTGAGKVYWRVKDSTGKWYSVWETTVKIRLETAAENSEAVKCAVQITPGKNGGKPFYTIAGTDAAADELAKQGSAKAVASRAPGGKNSEFNRRMHPDDVVRVTTLANIERAIQVVDMIMPDKPEAISCEQFTKAKTMEWLNFFNELVKMPLTPTPEPASTPASTPQATPGEPADDDIDKDIPF